MACGRSHSSAPSPPFLACRDSQKPRSASRGSAPSRDEREPGKAPPLGPPSPSATGSRGGRFDVPALAGEGGPGDSQGRLERVSRRARASQDRGVGRGGQEDEGGREGSPPTAVSSPQSPRAPQDPETSDHDIQGLARVALPRTGRPWLCRLAHQGPAHMLFPQLKLPSCHSPRGCRLSSPGRQPLFVGLVD